MASSSSRSAHPGWPSEPVPPAGSRKALPIKKEDAHPLSRDDVQYDLLDCIFSDPQKVFTSPTRANSMVNFRELYVDALYSSSRCSKVLRDKMLEIPAFAIELAKISLLTNVGRINTTMAFFPEMKTALRTYHPVPSLQKTEGNAQDAPRIKNCLKAALLPSEFKTTPSTPEEILQKRRSGQIPPTSVVNLIFVLSNHASPLASVHFDSSLNFYDLFLPRNLSSSDRARAFLWLVYYYLESPGQDNPFHDDYSRKNPNKVPLIRRLTDAEMEKENVDSPEEISWGRAMSNQRHAFLRKLVSSTEEFRKGRAREPSSSASQVQESETRRIRSQHSQQSSQEQQRPQQQQRRLGQQQRKLAEPDCQLSQSTSQPGPSALSASSTGEPAPIPHPPQRSSGTQWQERTMLQHAWHMVTSMDPLADSDEENMDEQCKLDYARRLDVLRRLYGGDPSCEDPPQGPSWPTEGDL